MDLQLGDGSQGADATRVLRGLDPEPHVLILTNYDTDADILSAVEAGASGHLLKERRRPNCSRRLRLPRTVPVPCRRP